MSCFPGKNKRVGKQLASQKILQMLHPHVKNWGSLLRMYGRESSKMVKKVGTTCTPHILYLGTDAPMLLEAHRSVRVV
jgi:hypothetical protein